jgi:hypothetical protein
MYACVYAICMHVYMEDVCMCIRNIYACVSASTNAFKYVLHVFPVCSHVCVCCVCAYVDMRHRVDFVHLPVYLFPQRWNLQADD